MRVIVDSVKDCYGAVGVIHSLWKPLPGRFKDFVAMPKFNMYQSLHTTVIGPEGRPLEIQIRTREMHDMAEYGVAAHWIYKESATAGPARRPTSDKLRWLDSVLDWQQELSDPQEFMETLKVDLFEDEVFVFTPKGEVKSLAAGATPLDFAYEVHTDVGHRCVGAKVNGKIVPLHYQLQSGDIVEVLTSKRERGPSRDWLAVVKTTRARNKIKQWFKAESRRDTEHAGRELLQEHLRKQGLPAQKIVGSALLADVIREMGFRKADDFYIALGGAKISPKVVVNKIMQRLKQGEAADGEPTAAADAAARPRAPAPAARRAPRPSSASGSRASTTSCCAWPSAAARCPGDPIVGYISLGRGITIHREDCPNAVALRKDPERFTAVSWDGDGQTRVQGRAPGRRLGPPPAARGPLARLLRAGREHHRGALPRQRTDGPEPLRASRCADTQSLKLDGHAPAQHRVGLRRLPRHAERRLGDDEQRARRDPERRLGDVADVVAVDLQRERARVGRAHSSHSTPSKPVTWRWLDDAGALGQRTPDRRVGMSIGLARRSTAPASVPESSSAPSADLDRAVVEVRVRVARSGRSTVTPVTSSPSPAHVDLRGGLTQVAAVEDVERRPA